VRGLPSEPPPGPARPGFWRSPLRSTWLTAALGSLLFPVLLLVGLTGFLSHAAYQPDLAYNAIVPRANDLDLLIFTWPTRPSWLYAATQGFHVTAGITVIPLLLAKLWSVIPRLFTWPPIRNPAHALERLSLLGLVGGALFEVATGVLNSQLYYPFGFNFVVAHYYGAWVFLLSLFLHVGIKVPAMRRAFRERGVLSPLSQSLAETVPEPYEPGGLAAPEPDEPSVSRRGLFGLVGAASAALFLTTSGQAIGGPLRPLALLATRGAGSEGGGPTGFPVNKTAASARVTRELVADWRLELTGTEPASFTREDLLAMELATHDLPIACVEGWSTTQRWTGVRLRDLAGLAGAPGARTLNVVSLQPRGVLRRATLGAGAIDDERSLLALRVNGVDLSLDHGYPARIIVPALPGVHNTKWVASLEFAA
jgi:DMSO/TMAO reductase YedYZ molybdopterin-dependent catalytic subunit